MGATQPPVDEFTRFARAIEPRMRYALIAALGYDRGREAAQDALVYAWEHWARINATENPAGYLYRVAKRRALRAKQRTVPVVDAAPQESHLPEPALESALRALSTRQRAAVYLIDAAGLTYQEAADLLNVSRATVQVHRRRGMVRLRRRLGVTSDA